MNDSRSTIARRTLLTGGAGAAALAGALGAAPAAWAGGGSSGPTPGGHGRRDFPVRASGAVPGASDAGPGIRAAIAAALAWTSADDRNSARVLLEHGVYRVGDDGSAGWYALELTGAARIELRGDRSELRFLNPHKGGIAITRSRSIAVTGIVLDYEVPPFTQGIVRAVDAAAGTVAVELLPGFPSLTDRALFGGAGYATLHVASTGLFKRGVQSTFSISYPAAPEADGRWAITVDPAHRGRIGDIAVGDGLVTGYRGDKNGIALHQSADTLLSGLTIHAAPGAAVISNNSDGTTLTGSTVDVRPGSGRWISSNADGYHHHGGRRGPTVVRNRFARLHDDGMNIYSQRRTVQAISGGGTVLQLSGGAAEFAAGDTVQLVEPTTSTIRGRVAVTAVEGDATTAAAITITVAKPVAGVAVGDDVFNRSYSAGGFVISDNTVTESRGLGIRMKSSNGVISGNRLSDLTNWGIWIANDAAYGEGPVGSENLVVTKNSLARLCLDQTLVPWPSSSAAIMLQNFTSGYAVGVSRSHKNVTIADNDIQDPPRFGVYLGAGSNVTATKTRIAETPANPRSDAPTAQIGLENLADSLVVGATIDDRQNPPRAVVWRGAGLANVQVYAVPGA